MKLKLATMTVKVTNVKYNYRNKIFARPNFQSNSAEKEKLLMYG